MSRTFHRPFPAAEKQMEALGQRLREARLRREISTTLCAERIGVSRDTLNRLEKGDPNIALGTYVRALRVLGLDKDLDAVARDDELGRKLQDLKLLQRKPRGRNSEKKASKKNGDQSEDES
ncbi:MAG: helix-turn-helix transcriptional regulator [Bdellovibrionaceae bacterium]|nr:helix-turn-helix transcriptional regulator [Pseudobdellovibrionaceae bacterium]